MDTEPLWILAYIVIGWLYLEWVASVERRLGNSPMTLGTCLWIAFGWPLVFVISLYVVFKRRSR